MKSKLKKNEFQCEMCQGIFRKARPDQQANAEARKRHGDLMDTEPVSVVCEDCHQKLCARYGWKE